jgi:hypothetical protein
MSKKMPRKSMKFAATSATVLALVIGWERRQDPTRPRPRACSRQCPTIWRPRRPYRSDTAAARPVSTTASRLRLGAFTEQAHDAPSWDECLF